MFNSNTVIVIGAGSSCEVGLPSGYDLKKQIAALLDIKFPDGYRQSSGDPLICEALKKRAAADDPNRADINPYLHKCWQISQVIPAAALSIDNYLDAHAGDESLELCGKLGIAKAILEAERGSKLMGTHRAGYMPELFKMTAVEKTWFVPLMNLLTERVHSRDVENLFARVSFVVFNYDRCLEHFLVRILTDYYGVPEGEAHAIVNKVRIFHPYGQVGRLPWQAGGQGVAFGETRYVDLLNVAAQLKTFTEKIEDIAPLAELRNAIAAADHLIFLGFAYHLQNLELLAPGKEVNIAKVFGTRLGVSNSDLDVICSYLDRNFRRADGGAFARFFVNGHCVDLFQEHWRGLAS
jgi:hypothetical protein